MEIQADVPLPDVKSEWTFVRVNSNGDVILRRDTNQTPEHVASVLNERSIPFEFSSSGNVFKVYNEKSKKLYQYYHTTGRWGAYRLNKYPAKHYHSKSIEDFLDRFFNKEFQNDTGRSERDN